MWEQAKTQKTSLNKTQRCLSIKMNVPTAWEVQANVGQFQDKHRGSVLRWRVSLTFGRPLILELENSTSSLIFDTDQGNDCHEWSESPPKGEYY